MQKEKIIKYYLGKFSVLFIGSSGNLDQCFKHGSASAQPGKPPFPCHPSPATFPLPPFPCPPSPVLLPLFPFLL